MSNAKPVMSKAQLLTKLERAWDALQRTIAGADAEDLVSRTDPAGWSSKDHLAHLAAWANSVLVMVRDGRPQWEGLGIDQALLENGDFDEQNEVIRQQTVDWPLDKVTSRLAEVHQGLVSAVSGMSDDDLLRPVSDFVDGGSDTGILQYLDGDGPNHYDEHREYIERILKG